MITYIEDNSEKYPPRTFANAARADATLAFAVDFYTAGEKLTKVAVNKSQKLYIPIDARSSNMLNFISSAILSDQRFKMAASLNIAGNSLKTLHPFINQEYCDGFVFSVIEKISWREKGISFICSGGQSGFDEAGLKAALKLGIPAICHCPKGWPFITKEGKTIRDEYAFKKRFDI